MVFHVFQQIREMSAFERNEGSGRLSFSILCFSTYREIKYSGEV